MSIRATRQQNMVWSDQVYRKELAREIKKRFPVILEPTNTHGGLVMVDGGAIGTPNDETPIREYVITSEAVSREWTSKRQYRIWVFDAYSVRRILEVEHDRLPDAILALQVYFMYG